MKLVALAAVLGSAALLAPAARSEEGGPAPAPAPAPAPQAKKAPKEPSRQVAARIEEALRGLFTGSNAGRIAARSALDAAVAEWAADAKEDPLRSVKWWRAALGGTLSAASHRAGISEEKVAYPDDREVRIWVSVPKGYSPKATYPLVLCILDKGEDPRKALGSHYGDLLKDWIVVAFVADPKEAGVDILREPWHAATGLRWAIENLRVDRDRVVLDAYGAAANPGFALASEWTVHFAGVVLRSPTVASPLVHNLALCRVLAVRADNATEPQLQRLEEVKAACPSAEIVDAKQGAEPVWKWIAAVPARRITNAEEASFTWRTRPQGGEPWAYWLWVFKAADPKKDRLVSITLARDPAAGTVDITSDNLAEGILLLNDDFLDLDREIAVKVNGREVWKGKPQREIRNAVYWIGQTGERTLFVPAQVRFTVPADAQSPPKKEAGALPGGDGPKDGKGSGEAPKQEGPAAPPAPAPGGKGGG